MKYIKTYEQRISIDLDRRTTDILLNHALSRHDLRLMRQLIEGGIDPNYDKLGHPLLVIEATKNDPNLEMVKLLIELGADVNFVDKYNNSSLIHRIFRSMKNTSKNKLLELVRILLEKGANLLVSDTWDWSGKNSIEIIEDSKESKEISNGFYNKLIKLIKELAPDQYEQYKLEADSNKYNL